MATKTSYLNLYASDNTSKKSLFVHAQNDKALLQAVDKVEFNAPVISLQGNLQPAYNISNLHDYLYTEKTQKDLKNASQDTSIATLQTDLASEIVNRQSAVTSVQNAVSAETNARTSADDIIVASVTQEVSDRTSADTVLQNAISQEITDRTNAISSEASARQSAITAEATARASAVSSVNARVDALLESTNIDLDQLHEIITAYQGADTNILNTVTTLQTNLTTLQGRFDELVAEDSASSTSPIITAEIVAGSSQTFTVVLAQDDPEFVGNFSKIYVNEDPQNTTNTPPFNTYYDINSYAYDPSTKTISFHSYMVQPGNRTFYFL